MEKIVVFGCGGHALSVSDAIISKSKYNIAGYIDKELGSLSLWGKKIIGVDSQLSEVYKSGLRYGAMGIGSVCGGSNIRWKVYQNAKMEGFSFPVISDPTAIISDNTTIGEGTFIGKRAVVNADVSIGECSIINTGAIVEHSVSIGNNSHISVGSAVCGEVSIGNNCMIGAGAVIVQGVKIGNNVTIGAGAVVIRDVEDCKIVVGNPAREMK